MDAEAGTQKSITEKQLVAGIRQRDYAAFEAVFETYYVELVRYADKLVKSRDIAEGLIQDLFVKIWCMGEEWAPQHALRVYLFAMARNICIAYLRKSRRRDSLLERWMPRGQVEPGVDTDLEMKELRYAAQRAVEMLPERRRQVFILSRNHGLTYVEIAALMGISVKTVEAHMGQALKFLRDRLASFRPTS